MRTRSQVLQVALALSLAAKLLPGCVGSKKHPEVRAAPQDLQKADSDKPIPSEIAGQGTSIVDLPIDDSSLANTAEIVARMGLTSYHGAGFHGQNVKIAILDNGFAGLSNSIGRRLPPGTRLLKSPRPEMQVTSHGVKLAEIAYAVATGSAGYQSHIDGPEIVLANTNGYTNLVGAIDQIISEKVDIVLYAQVWEYGGNFDGGGFINQQVRRALDAGILWVNAAGNMGQGTWSGAVKFDAHKNVTLPYRDQLRVAQDASYVRFTVPQDQTPVKIVLAWNDFSDDKDYKTSQDLDLFLEASDGTSIATSQLIQDGVTDPATDNRYSAHAREIVQTLLPPGTYYLRVTANPATADQFNANSRLRLSVDGLGVKLLDQTTEDTVLIPADNPDVLTIGAADVDYSGQQKRAGKLVKPELNVISQVIFQDGGATQEFMGTSAATALAVGALAVFQSSYGTLSHNSVVDLTARGILCRPRGNNNSSTAPVLELQ